MGVVRDTVIDYYCRKYPGALDWMLPVVAETWDGFLSDINGFHVRPEHVVAALDSAAAGPVAEGCVGGGTGMCCHEFKGGIGTSSRVLPKDVYKRQARRKSWAYAACCRIAPRSDMRF